MFRVSNKYDFLAIISQTIFLIPEVSSNIDLYKNHTNFPTMEDINGTINSLAIMQEVYRLNTSTFASGQLGKLKYDSELSPWDCIQFSNYYYEKDYFNYSHAWFEEAKKRLLRNKSNDFTESDADVEYLQSRMTEMGKLYLILIY